MSFLLLKQTAVQFGATIGAEVTLHLYNRIKYSSTQNFKHNEIKPLQHTTHYRTLLETKQQKNHGDFCVWIVLHPTKLQSKIESEQILISSLDDISTGRMELH